MKKNIISYILLVFLIGVNVFFLIKYLGETNADKEKGGKDPMSFVMQQLNLNTLQSEKIEVLNKKHHTNMMRINEDIKNLKDVLFISLNDNSNDEKAVDSIANLIGEKQEIKEKEIYYHFKSIQELCDEKQKETLKKILKDALRKGDNENRPPPPDGQKRPNGTGPDGHRPPPPNNL
jgi:hypothetical protein